MVLIAAVLGGIGLGYLLLVSTVLGARTVTVAGTSYLTPDQVRQAAAIPFGTPLLRLDTAAVATRVRTLPPAAEVRVDRTWPAGVTITITERLPVAYLATPQGSQLVDGAGVGFATVATVPAGIPELRAATPEAVTAAAGVLTALAAPGREALRAELIAVSADSPFDVRFTLAGDRTVRWGSAEDSDRKAAVLSALLTQPGSVYDVASPDLPTIR
ncbi:MAG TPA: FtsQ-type POTRA domain-containing protein [Pseudonocardiaceae bacterium]